MSLALNNVNESQFRTDVGREFQTDDAAVLKERLLKDVGLKRTSSSGADDNRSDCVLLRVAVHILLSLIHI